MPHTTSVDSFQKEVLSSMAHIISSMRLFLKDIPDPSVTLVGKKWGSPYLVLISCILSLRTKDVVTLDASMRLFNLAKTPYAMIKLSVQQIEKAIYPVGFFHTKAKRILKISKDIIDRFKGDVPDTMEDLLSLKGVGLKTANLVLVEGFGQYAICVDTHVHRISNRLGLLQTKTPKETEEVLRAVLPKKYWKEYNALLVLWGQNICRPISPKCSTCVVKKYCYQVGVKSSR